MPYGGTLFKYLMLIAIAGCGGGEPGSGDAESGGALGRLVAAAPVCGDVAVSTELHTNGTTVGAGNDFTATTCPKNGTGKDYAYEFTAPATGRYLVDTTGTLFNDVLYALDGCGGAEIACSNDFDVAVPGAESLLLDLTAGQVAVVVVDSFRKPGAFSLNITPVPDVETNCADGVDEDYDLALDCSDADCAASPDCFETCGDGVDNDGNGLVDCEEHACKVLAECDEICDDGVDNDNDFRPDCLDLECDLFLACTETSCNDGVDNNNNFNVDCFDLDCIDFLGCAEICDDGVDNNGNGLVDCYDHPCQGALFCTEDCADGLDNDGDFATDCGDADCDALVQCLETKCKDGLDNDGNSLADCRDPDCDTALACKENCKDGIDNDNDFLTDCADSTCATKPTCQEVCDDGVDNDGNSLVDCFDPDCSAFATCAEQCADGADSDHDGLVDCDDADCDLDAACAEDCANLLDDDGDARPDCLDSSCAADLACAPVCPQVDLGGVAPVELVGDTYGAPDAFTSRCAPDAALFGLFGSASDASHTFTAPVEGDYTFDSRNSSFAVLLAIVDGDCLGTELVCESGAFTPNPVLVVHLLQGQTVVVVVDGSDASHSGPYVINVY